MKQVRAVPVVLFFIVFSILLSSRYEVHSDTDQDTDNRLSLGLKYDLSFARPYFTGAYPGETDRTDKVGRTDMSDETKSSGCMGCSCEIVPPARHDFYLSDSAGPIRLPGSDGYYDEGYPKEVDDLVDDYFDGDISYGELEDRLDDLGWGLDPYWGPYPYSKLRLAMMGCDGYYYSGYGSYGYRPYPETDGIQFDQFRLINPQRIRVD